MKKIFAIILTLCMTLSLFSIANAAELNYDGSAAPITTTETTTHTDTTVESEAYTHVRLDTLILSDNVTTIKENAFLDSLVKNLVIGKNVSTIDDMAFINSLGIENIVVSEENPYFTSVDGVLFNDDMTELVYFPAGKYVKTYTVPDTVIEIGKYAFNSNQFIRKIELPDNLMFINSHAFEYMHELTSINIPDGIDAIGNYAFYFCSKLTDVSFPSSLRVIGEHAFQACSSLSDITFNEGLMTLANYAFADTAIKNVVLPSSMMVIGNLTFAHCLNLTSVTLNEGLVAIASQGFAYCENLEEITIPASVSVIEHAAFYKCYNLSSITIKNGLFALGVLAFGYTAIKDITLPESIATVDLATFDGCDNLENLYILNKEATINSYEGLVTIPVHTTIHAYCHNLVNNPANHLPKTDNLSRVPASAYEFAVKNGNNFVSLGHVGEDICTVCGKDVNIEVVPAPEFEILIDKEFTVGDIADVIIETDAEGLLKVEYFSSDDTVIAVDKNGIVTAVGEGTATITVILRVNGVESTKTATITVKAAEVENNTPDNNTTEGPRCLMCDDYEANIGTPLEILYKIIHTIVHLFSTMFA